MSRAPFGIPGSGAFSGWRTWRKRNRGQNEIKMVVAFHCATTFRSSATLVLDHLGYAAVAIVETCEDEEREGQSNHLDRTLFL
jgi:hypothetical protein